MKNKFCDNLIYFDNAATSYPKPCSVINEVSRCMREYCGNPGRSSHALSVAAARKIYECREKIAELFSVKSPENVVFTCNTTHALNMAIKSVATSGSHILISNIEHNAVYRPVCALRQKGVAFSQFDALAGSDDAIIESIKANITPRSKALVCLHSSNVASITLPIEKIGQLCKEKDIVFIVDVAQSAGHMDIDVSKCNIDILCAPGHKGLYGPQGSGFMIVSDTCKVKASNLETTIEGGSGVNSFDKEMPQMLPERFEAGTLSTPAIAGLCEGVRIVSQIGTKTICAHENALYRRMREILLNTKDIILYMPEAECGSVLLFNVCGKDPNEVASNLDALGVCVRSGFHCAPLAHKALCTGNDGAIRISFGMYNTLDEVERFYRKLKQAICSC